MGFIDCCDIKLGEGSIWFCICGGGGGPFSIWGGAGGGGGPPCTGSGGRSGGGGGGPPCIGGGGGGGGGGGSSCISGGEVSSTGESVGSGASLTSVGLRDKSVSQVSGETCSGNVCNCIPGTESVFDSVWVAPSINNICMFTSELSAISVSCREESIEINGLNVSHGYKFVRNETRERGHSDKIPWAESGDCGEKEAVAFLEWSTDCDFSSGFDGEFNVPMIEFLEQHEVSEMIFTCSAPSVDFS